MVVQQQLIMAYNIGEQESSHSAIGTYYASRKYIWYERLEISTPVS